MSGREAGRLRALARARARVHEIDEPAAQVSARLPALVRGRAAHSDGGNTDTLSRQPGPIKRPNYPPVDNVGTTAARRRWNLWTTLGTGCDFPVIYASPGR